MRRWIAQGVLLLAMVGCRGSGATAPPDDQGERRRIRAEIGKRTDNLKTCATPAAFAGSESVRLTYRISVRRGRVQDAAVIDGDLDSIELVDCSIRALRKWELGGPFMADEDISVVFPVIYRME